MAIQWEDRFDQLGHLGDDQLLHLARNEAAIYEYRLTAVEILQSRGSNAAKHADLWRLALETTSAGEQAEVTHESETVPVEEDFGPLKASVTTETMLGVQKMDEPKEIVPAVEAQKLEQN